MIRRPPRSTPLYSSAASDVYKRQNRHRARHGHHRGPDDPHRGALRHQGRPIAGRIRTGAQSDCHRAPLRRKCVGSARSDKNRPTKIAAMSAPYTLILLRHGHSEWNAENLFTGWVDVDLNEQGFAEAARGAELLRDAGLTPDVHHTSLLRRAIRTAQQR